MTKETDLPSTAAQAPSASAPPSSASANLQRKPSFALFIATAAGLGYLPKAPGTWGSLAGVALYVLVGWLASIRSLPMMNMERDVNFWTSDLSPALVAIPAAIIVAVVGLWTSDLVSKYSSVKDPQFVVVDEVSGQQLTYLLGAVVGNWKYLLLGFILFRVFDIWKPFPARQAESLPGGWGIMADDWIAAIYAALGLWIARAFGL
jgi:phosphatidylglycerophosphatase A